MVLGEMWREVNGRRMFARTAGLREHAGPAVVLVHGLGVSGRYMIPTARALAPRVPVYVPDLPGFGQSEKPERVLNTAELADNLAAWMDAADLSEAVLVGNSFGCQILLEFALRHPARAKRLVLQGPTMDRHARTTWQQFGRLLVDTFREPPTQPLVVFFDYLVCGPVRFWRTFRIALADRPEEKLARVGVPTLVVRGSRDPIVSQRWAEEMAAGLPCGRLVIIPGGPHTVNYARPADFVRVMLPFLDAEKAPPEQAPW